VLINKNRIAVGADRDQSVRHVRSLIGFDSQLHTLILQPALQLSDISQ
jgi:hypothetical protein